MRNLLLLLLFIFLTQSGIGQVAPDKYYVKFTDKNNSPWSIDNPEEFLTDRAIERRARYSIPVTNQDLPVNPAYLQGVADAGANLINPTKWLNGVTIYTTEQSVLDAIAALPYVQGVFMLTSDKKNAKDPDFEKPFFANESIVKAGNEKLGSSTRDIDYGNSFNQIEMINGIELHEQGFLGQGMVIAVLDAGFIATNTLPIFDSLWANDQILGTKDFVSHSGNVFDHHPHGTSVLSTMGGYHSGELVGTAPKADYWLLRSEDGATEYLIEEYNWISAAEFADSVGADVINSSLGYTEFDDPAHNHTYNDMDGNTAPITIGADIAASKGILVVNSAGNSGGSSWHYIGAPADGDSVFTIGAVEPDGTIAGFSSRGPTSDGRIKPDIVAQGAPAYVASAWGGYGWGNGTSFSSPIAAGMSACLWQANQSLNNMEIIEAIKQFASYANGDDPNNDYGWGIPDYYQSYYFVTSIKDSNAGFEGLIIRPNPLTENTLYFETGNLDDILSMQIIDQSGRVIKEYNEILNRSVRISRIEGLDGLPAGIYFLRITQRDATLTGKFIK